MRCVALRRRSGTSRRRGGRCSPAWLNQRHGPRSAQHSRDCGPSVRTRRTTSRGRGPASGVPGHRTRGRGWRRGMAGVHSMCWIARSESAVEVSTISVPCCVDKTRGYRVRSPPAFKGALAPPRGAHGWDSMSRARDMPDGVVGDCGGPEAVVRPRPSVGAPFGQSCQAGSVCRALWSLTRYSHDSF